ncbi:hypothetical protein BD413DRAFT_570488 [Trametes elegans]|nr:hypothetical protein BD413DRAFT_570488 [Trametes elegans]
MRTLLCAPRPPLVASKPYGRWRRGVSLSCAVHGRGVWLAAITRSAAWSGRNGCDERCWPTPGLVKSFHSQWQCIASERMLTRMAEMHHRECGCSPLFGHLGKTILLIEIQYVLSGRVRCGLRSAGSYDHACRNVGRPITIILTSCPLNRSITYLDFALYHLALGPSGERLPETRLLLPVRDVRTGSQASGGEPTGSNAHSCQFALSQDLVSGYRLPLHIARGQ